MVKKTHVYDCEICCSYLLCRIEVSNYSKCSFLKHITFGISYFASFFQKTRLKIQGYQSMTMTKDPPYLLTVCERGALFQQLYYIHLVIYIINLVYSCQKYTKIHNNLILNFIAICFSNFFSSHHESWLSLVITCEMLRSRMKA